MTSKEAIQDLRRQINEAKKRFAEKAMLVSDNKVQAVANACNMIEGTSKRLMREATTNPNVAYGRKKHNPSIPGSAPAPDTGTMMRSVTHDVSVHFNVVIGRVGSVLKSPPYPAYLENGTTTIEPRPWLLPSVDINKPRINQQFKKVFEDRPMQAIIEAVE
jgi:hypothetical protein